MLLSRGLEMNVQFNDKAIKSFKFRKPYEVHPYKKLEMQAKIFFKKSNRKVNIIVMTTSCMNLSENQILGKFFLKAKFNCHLVIWIFHSLL